MKKELQIKRIISVIVAIIIMSSSFADAADENPQYSDERMPFDLLAGVYLDSFTGLSVKGGAFYEIGETETGLYADIELGTEAQKISAGLGKYSGPTLFRLGLSVAQEDSDNHFGLEGVLSLLLVSVKFGVYSDSNSSNEIFSIGFGLGF